MQSSGVTWFPDPTLENFIREAARRGLDPNKWFNHVELVAADKIGAETLTYVAYSSPPSRKREKPRSAQ